MTGWVAIAAAGTPLGSAGDGWTLAAPDGWRAEGGGTSWVLSREGDPGVVVVTYTHGATWADLQAQAATPMQDAGMVLAPVSAPVLSTTRRAVAADYQGRTADGAPVAAHAVGVAGAAGGLVVLGLGPSAGAATLARTVDALAEAVVWTTPDRGPVASVRGDLCGGLALVRMTFDGAGRVVTTSPATPEGAAASYLVSGDDLVVRYPDGAERRCVITRRDAGAVVAVDCGGKPWTAAQCVAPR